jgi:hypothetical protein
MSNGGAQYASFGPFWDATNNVVYEDINIYAYVAGAYSVAKNFWTAEGKTGAVTSRQGDDTGTVSGYFDGDYNLEIKSSDDVTTIVQIPNMKITSDSGTLWEGAQGTAYPAADPETEGMMFAKIDGSNVVRGLAISNGSSWVEFYTADSSGNQTIDSVITKATPVYNVKHQDWGALGDGATDDTSAVQLAIDAIATAGAGVLYFPLGTYVIDGTLDINNCSIKIFGDGAGQTYLLQKNSPAGPMIDFDSNNVLDVFITSDITIESQIGSVTSGDHAIDITFSEATHNFPTNVYIHRTTIMPTNDTKTTSGFDYFLTLTDAKKPIITDCEFRGHTGGALEGQGIRLLGDTNTVKIDNCIFRYLDLGVMIAGSSDEVYLTGCEMQNMRQNVDIESSANVGFKDCRMAAFDKGIEPSASAVPTNFEVSDCKIVKHSASTSNWVGVTIDAVNYSLTGNTILDGGSASGTDYGILLTTGTSGVINNNTIKDVRTNGIRVAANQSGFTMNNNTINASVIGINVLAGTSDDYVIVGNNLEGCTTGITDGGTGTTKYVGLNTSGGVSNWGVLQVETATVSTSDSTVTTLWSKTMDANTSYTIQADIAAVQASGGTSGEAAVGGMLSITVDDGGIRNSTETYYYEENAVLAIAADVSGSDVRIRVTGYAAVDVNWKASVRILGVAV